jgi:hypothetical protein
MEGMPMEGQREEVGTEEMLVMPRCRKVPEDRIAEDAEAIVERERRRRRSDD